MYVNACIAYQCHKVARYSYHRPTYDLPAAKNPQHKTRAIQKILSIEKKFKTLLESGQEIDWAKSRTNEKIE